jgi:hypothetical protein
MALAYIPEFYLALALSQVEKARLLKIEFTRHSS